MAVKVSKLKRVEKVTLILFLLPTLYLLSFFVAPVASVLGGLLGFDWHLLNTPFYINLKPIGSPIEIRSFGPRLFIVIKGVNMGVILNSLINSIIVTLVSAVIGTAAALLIGLYDFPGRRLFAVLAALPLLVAPFVNTYVVKLLYGFNLQGNTLSYLLQHLGLKVTIGFTQLGGITLAQILAFYPIVYINVLAALGAIDASLIEQALNLGSRGFKLIRTIILPMIVPGILAGATLVYILSLEDVGAPIVFNYKNVISYQVYEFFQEFTSIGGVGASAALCLIMLLLALIPMAIIRKYLSLKYYARLSRGAPRPFKRLKLGKKGLIVAYLLVLPVLIAAAAPQIGIIVLAFSERWVGALPQGFTLRNFYFIFSKPGVFRGIVNSVTYLAFALPMIAILGFAAAYVVARIRVKGIGLLDLLSTAPLAVPGLVVAFGYFIFFHAIAQGTPLDPLVSPAVVLVLAYAARKMPFTVRSVYTGLLQTPRAMEEAAESLGATKGKVLRSIVLPLVWRSIIAGLLLSSIYVLSEVSVSVTIGALGGDIVDPNHAGPITYVIMRLIQAPSISGGAQPQAVAAAMAAILMALEALVLFVATSRLARRGQMLVSV
ncbi:iron ABC transporter permease [Ignicoccus pacificus DSM 13166]|uniref:Iron ABC transporter permease n=1 Tax=Ignicoccus pacificus DSM 13166 TaxID=940294 RepID=A0A977K9S6_9CREN|nr:iron ABC transporter permease [Ignicoccus pacificus DSM 13166]